MSAVVYVFYESSRERAALERDLARMSLEVRSFTSGTELAQATIARTPALVLWDVDTERADLARLGRVFGCPVIGLTSDSTRVRTDEERELMLLLPFERWRLIPVVARLLTGPEGTRPVHVLVADDDEVFQHIIGYQLEMMHWKVTRALDGVEALALAQAGGVDVLLVDLNLPHRNGFELLEQLDARAKGALRVIVLSEQAQDDKVVRSFELGAHDFVEKPLSPRVLVSRVQRLLRAA